MSYLSKKNDRGRQAVWVLYFECLIDDTGQAYKLSSFKYCTNFLFFK